MIIGAGAAGALTLEGETVLDGAFAAQTLNVSANASVVLPYLEAQVPSSLTVNGDATLTDGDTGLLIEFGRLVDGHGLARDRRQHRPTQLLRCRRRHTDRRAKPRRVEKPIQRFGGRVSFRRWRRSDTAQSPSQFSIDGAGSQFTVGGTFTSLGDTISASDGARVGLNALQGGVGASSGVTLTADAQSSIEVGSFVDNATAGAIKIDANVSMTEYGAISAPTIDIEGDVGIEPGQSLRLNGGVDGSGKVTIDAGSSLTIDATLPPTVANIVFSGGDGTLSVSGSALNSTQSFLPMISGFDPTDVLDVQGVANSAKLNGSTLTLYNGTTAVANFDLPVLGVGGSETFSTVLINNGTVTQVTENSATPPPAQSSIEAAPPQGTTTVVAGSQQSYTITVTVRNSQGDLVAGAPVTLTTNGTGNIFDNSPAQFSGVTNSSGQLTAQLSSSVAQVETVTATETEAGVSYHQVTSVTFVGGPSITGTVAGQKTLSEAPVSPFSTVKIEDTNPGATETLTINLSDSGPTGLTGVLSGNGLTLNKDGSYSLTGSAGTVTSELNALVFTPSPGQPSTTSVTTFNLSDTNDIDPSVMAQNSTTTVANTDPAVAPTLTIVASPATVTANGTSVTTLTVTVEDANGNSVAGTAVTLSASGHDNSFGAISGTTNASGVFTTTLASTLAQTETVTATEGSGQESTSVTFVAGPPAATTFDHCRNPGDGNGEWHLGQHVDGDG